MDSCPFGSLDPSRKWVENDHALAFPDAYPLPDGHTLVVPRKHVASIYELTAEKQSAIWSLVAEVRERLLTGLKPDAFNIGLNDGLAAGQTVEHASVSLILRKRDTVFVPRSTACLRSAEHATDCTPGLRADGAGAWPHLATP
jgi:diadenosine tetraphosphate (Ap4A) HIT family hydrolase